MIEKIIKQIIRAAIESFPINENKKSEMLQSIIGQKIIWEVENDELQ